MGEQNWAYLPHHRRGEISRFLCQHHTTLPAVGNTNDATRRSRQCQKLGNMISEVVHIEHSVLVNPDLSFSINMRTEIVFHISEVRFPKIFLHVVDQFISTRGINHVFISLSLQPEAPPPYCLAVSERYYSPIPDGAYTHDWRFPSTGQK